jgi:isopenicillin N synthase-like dioxygenase
MTLNSLNSLLSPSWVMSMQIKTIHQGDQGLEIPVIDLQNFLHQQPGALQSTAQALGEASEGLGFYFVKHHGVKEDLIDRMFEQTARFHSMPLEAKLTVQVTDRVVGYLPSGGQTQRTSIHGTSDHPDTSSSYYIRQEFAQDHPDRLNLRPWVFDNKWIQGLPGFKETMLEYYDAMQTLVSQILRLQSVALDLGEAYLPEHQAFAPPVYNLRLLHYPPFNPNINGQFGIGPHTDYGYLTILAQGRVPGLEVLTRDQRWLEVPALEGHLLINNADLCSRWTNNRYRSAPHRVINKTGETRHSIPFFTAPRSDVLLKCLPTCESQYRPTAYAPITAGEYFAAINQKNYDILKNSK